MRSFLFLAAAVCAWGQPRGGERLYLEHCAPCHGSGGYDGFAANLAVTRLPHAPDDRSLARLIRNGFEGTDMPPAFGVTDADVSAIVAHVRSLGRAPRQNVPGNAARGKQIYETKGNCAQCHMIAGQGARQAPDLSEIGARRGASHLRQSLTDPEASLPHGFLLVSVSTRDGRAVRGIRINEDTYSIRLRDLSGRNHSFWKTEIANLRKEWGKSTMPSYKESLNAGELDDVIAYLASLRGDL